MSQARTAARPDDAANLYHRLEDRIMSRDQVAPAKSITIWSLPAGR